MTTTVREKVEAWLRKAPEELNIKPVQISRVDEYLRVMGDLTARVYHKEYEGMIEFSTKLWDEKGEEQ